MSQKSQIHSTAVIEEGAQIASDVTIGPYAVIGKNCKIERGATIREHVVLDGCTTIGENTTIFPSAVIGAKTQDLKYKGEITYVVIGKNTQIREFVTINSSCGEGTVVKVGDNCLIMANCHIAHNCEVGNRVIMGNNAGLAGHVIVEDNAIISGLTGVHQYCRIGCYAMIGGMSRVSYDVPPYTIGMGIPYRLGGLNLVGLKRNNFPLKTRQLLSQAFRYVFRSGLSVQEGIGEIENNLEPIAEILHFVNFLKNSKRGIIDTGIKESEQDLEPLDELENILQALKK